MSSDHPPRRIIYRGTKIDLALQLITRADGSTVEREVVLHRGAVALLAVVDADHLCLVRNRRYAVGATLLEVPAGTIDPGELPEATAARELREETGYTAERLQKLTSWWVSPGVFNECMHLFACTGLTPGPNDLAPDEELEPVVVSWDDALRMVADQRISDAKSMLAIFLGDRWRRGEWVTG
jgi:ADP-ribose pyrophosphatase